MFKPWLTDREETYKEFIASRPTFSWPFFTSLDEYTRDEIEKAVQHTFFGHIFSTSAAHLDGDGPLLELEHEPKDAEPTVKLNCRPSPLRYGGQDHEW